MFSAEMNNLLQRDPDRAKAFIRRQATSKDDHNRETAAIFAEPLAAHDFALASKVLIHVFASGWIVPAEQQEGVCADEIAGMVIADLTRTNNSEEARALLEAQDRIIAEGPYHAGEIPAWITELTGF